jgi:hypothetical protein
MSPSPSAQRRASVLDLPRCAWTCFPMVLIDFRALPLFGVSPSGIRRAWLGSLWCHGGGKPHADRDRGLLAAHRSRTGGGERASSRGRCGGSPERPHAARRTLTRRTRPGQSATTETVQQHRRPQSPTATDPNNQMASRPGRRIRSVRAPEAARQHLLF